MRISQWPLWVRVLFSPIRLFLMIMGILLGFAVMLAGEEELSDDIMDWACDVE